MSLFINPNDAKITGTTSGNSADPAVDSPESGSLSDSLVRTGVMLLSAAFAGIVFQHGSHRSQAWLSKELKKQNIRFRGEAPERVLNRAKMNAQNFANEQAETKKAEKAAKKEEEAADETTTQA
jgi:hypothetical protein